MKIIANEQKEGVKLQNNGQNKYKQINDGRKQKGVEKEGVDCKRKKTPKNRSS